MKILLVDDDAVRSQRLTEWLCELGFVEEDVVSVSSVNDARVKMTDSYFDVLLLDVVLPRRQHDQPMWKNGIWLLNYINSSARVRKPEKIIGITAYIDDISSFKAEFEKLCLVVIEVQTGYTDWQEKLSHAINYTRSSKYARGSEGVNVFAITVHGIRTFGHWQSRLKALTQANAGFIEFQSYKYGYFPVFFFMVPFFQRREVFRLKEKLKVLFSESGEKKLVIFSHSFGTYLAAHALRELSKESNLPVIDKLVLSGSVLKSNFDWGFIKAFPGMKVINDCGTHDYVLWLSEAFIPKTGMAGKTGFYGFHTDRFINRFFKGGHDLYFRGDDFMESNWLPLFSEDPVKSHDERGESNIVHMFFEKTFAFVGTCLPLVIISAGLASIWYYFT
ncbi:alpha/beta hydrolase [Pseudomonas sp. ANT_H12B]|uniref:alpha/beta hydrolase n=1 Tax=Pseudomonas sp. ANT_H12B TaxID=2597348 RepID=UPI0011ED0401|nr:alpha/beta hydrolase [Pseudomonas sp. ANT_H12B]KAA0975697.1 response regulator [Pseudomonas sp. ANT_H12B]